jgi:multicomponent Na+:H+ antiporter subunit D
MVSALLTAIYMMSISFRAFCPGRDFDDSGIRAYHDPGWRMLLPLVIFVVLLFVFGLHSGPLVEWFGEIASPV